MTIGNQSVKTDVVADGVNFTFDYDFLVPEDGATRLYLTDPEGVEAEISSSAYTVANEGDPDGGTFTYPLSGSPTTSGWTLTLVRDTPYTQATNLNNQGAYYPESVEGGLDWLAQQTQQLSEKVGRAMQAPVAEGPIGPLPPLEARKGMILGFDAVTGEPEATTPGEPGPPGTDGALWFNSVGMPSNTIGNDGDYNLESDGTVDEKISGSWTDTGINLRGPAGTTTITGGVLGPVSSTISNIATWADTVGGEIDDSGIAIANVPLLDATTNTFTGSSLEITKSSDGADGGPYIDISRLSASPADNDLVGGLRYYARNDAAQFWLVGDLEAQALDVTDGTEDGLLYLRTMIAGSAVTQMSWSAGIVVGAATGGAQGTGSLNAEAYYQDGALTLPITALADSLTMTGTTIGNTASSGGYEGQIQTATYGTQNTVSATIDVDSGIPANTEGTEILTLAFTPNNASSRLWIQAVVHLKMTAVVTSNSTASATGVVALFVDSTANALQSVVGARAGGQAPAEATWTYITEQPVVLEFEVAATTTAARTYKIRIGKNTEGSITSSTMVVNSATMGGTKVSRLTVIEIPPET